MRADDASLNTYKGRHGSSTTTGETPKGHTAPAEQLLTDRDRCVMQGATNRFQGLENLDATCSTVLRCSIDA